MLQNAEIAACSPSAFFALSAVLSQQCILIEYIYSSLCIISNARTWCCLMHALVVNVCPSVRWHTLVRSTNVQCCLQIQCGRHFISAYTNRISWVATTPSSCHSQPVALVLLIFHISPHYVGTEGSRTNCLEWMDISSCGGHYPILHAGGWELYTLF